MSSPAHLRRHPRRIAPGTRLLLVLGLLAGLFAMHGLSTSHHVPAAGDHAAAAVGPIAAGHPPGHLAGAAHDAPDDDPDDDPAPRSGADTAGACLAVLTVVALALLLLGARPAAAPRRSAPARPAPRVHRRSLPDPRPPDLSVLCVLRT